MHSCSKKARPTLRLCPVPSAPPESAGVHPRIAAAPGATVSCSKSSPILLIQSTPSGVSGWVKTATPTTSIPKQQTQLSPPASAAPDRHTSATPFPSVNPRLIGLSNYTHRVAAEVARRITAPPGVEQPTASTVRDETVRQPPSRSRLSQARQRKE